MRQEQDAAMSCLWEELEAERMVLTIHSQAIHTAAQEGLIARAVPNSVLGLVEWRGCSLKMADLCLCVS